jgi:hypothetical protein
MGGVYTRIVEHSYARLQRAGASVKLLEMVRRYLRFLLDLTTIWGTVHIPVNLTV